MNTVVSSAQTDTPECPIVQNLVTDCLDYIIQNDLDNVYLSDGTPPIFGKDQGRIDAPEFAEQIEEQDLTDCLEALFLDRPKTELGISFYHQSEVCDWIAFSVDIAPITDGLDATIARFRRVGKMPNPLGA